MIDDQVVGEIGEEGRGAEDGPTHEVGSDRREDRPEERVDGEVPQDDLETEEHPRERGVERGRDPSGRPAGDEDAQSGLGHPNPLAESRRERRPDLYDRALPPNGSAGADTDGRGQGLHHGDLGADAPAVLCHGKHDLGHTVPTRFLGETLDQRPVENTADDRDQEEEPDPEPREVRARNPALLSELSVTGGKPCHAQDQPTERHGAKAGAHSDDNRHHHQPQVGGSKRCRR